MIDAERAVSRGLPLWSAPRKAWLVGRQLSAKVERAFLACILAPLLMADRVNYAAWASRIGRARSLDEVGERVAAIRPRA